MGAWMSNTWGLLKSFRSGPHVLNPGGEHPAVVRTNVGIPAVGLLTQETIQCVFDPDLVDKEGCFLGYAEIPEGLRRGFCPSMFANGEDHRRKKAFLIDALNGGQGMLPSILFKKILVNFEKWSRLEAVEDFEDRLLFIVSEAMTEAVFGKKLDGRVALAWLNGCIKVRSSIPVPGYAEKYDGALEALDKLLKAAEESPKYKELSQLCRSHNLEVEDGIFNVVYTLLFNAAAAITAAIVTSIARLHTSVTETEKDDILRTTLQALEKHGSISEESLSEMNSLESFILEVLRLHPPVFNFWAAAKKDFVVLAGEKKIEVRKGEQLLGSCFWAQRDATAFYKPELFQCRRFIGDEVDGGKRSNLLFPRGRFTHTPDLDSHQCPSQDIAFFMMKSTLAVLLCYCSWELSDTPVWSDKTTRVGKPDDLVSFTSFSFNLDEARRVLGNEK